MKIRNGFVSNSSSSSFILTYNKNKVLNSPEEIIDFVTNNPNRDISISKELSDGVDFVELKDSWKSFIRKYPEEFTRANLPYKNYFGEEVRIKAYIDGEYSLSSNETISSISLSREDYLKVVEKNKIEQTEKLSNRLNLDKENICSDKIDLDYNSSYFDKLDTDYDFVERYISAEDNDDYYDYCFRRKANKTKSNPFVVTYDYILKGKEDIVNYLNSPKSKKSNNVITWYNSSIEDAKVSNFTIVDFYEIGDKEIEFINKNKDDFLKSNRSILLITNFNLFTSSLDLDGISFINSEICYGKVKVLKKGRNIKDFEDSMKGVDYHLPEIDYEGEDW